MERNLELNVDILEKGYRWKIGNGGYINPWTDPWLRRDARFTVETPINPCLMNMKVSDLWIPGTRQWDVEMVRKFSRLEMPMISLEYHSIGTSNQILSSGIMIGGATIQ